MYFLHSFTGKCTFTGKYSSLELPLNISVKLSPLKSTTDSVDSFFSNLGSGFLEFYESKKKSWVPSLLFFNLKIYLRGMVKYENHEFWTLKITWLNF